jgi:hypothetical protein
LRVVRRLLELAKDEVQQAHSCVPRDDKIAALMEVIDSELDAHRPVSLAALVVFGLLVVGMMVAHSIHAV